MLYEPIIDLSTGQVVGLEAQAPAAAQGEIAGLEAILDEVAADLDLWQAREGEETPWPVPVHLALSVAQLSWPELAERLVYRLERAGVRPDQLVLELESSGGEALSRAGFGLARRNWGAGRELLGELLDPAWSLVKLDPALISGIPAELAWTRLNAGVLKLLDSLNLVSGAAGVQSASQRDHLARNGCRVAQGGFYGPLLEGPLVPEAIYQGTDRLTGRA